MRGGGVIDIRNIKTVFLKARFLALEIRLLQQKVTFSFLNVPWGGGGGGWSPSLNNFFVCNIFVS